MPQRPNIVFVFPDQYRQAALGFLGQDPVHTPHLDRFAAEGLVLTHAVSNHPICSPFRAMLFSGAYPHRNGVVGNCNSRTARDGCWLSASQRCLSDVLAAAGYSLGYLGKWHLDAPRPQDTPFTEGLRADGLVWDAYTPPGPRRHGFDFWHAYGCCDRHLDPHYWIGAAPVDRPFKPHTWSVRHETDVAVEYLRNEGARCRRPDAPFALFVAYNPPHTPFELVPPEYLDAYAGRSCRDLLVRPNVRFEGPGLRAAQHARNYFAACTGVDEQFGRVLGALDETGLAGQTIVIFCSDHGEMMGSHGRMNKELWYDESLRIPFLVRWPGAIPARRDDLLLSVPDLLPTLLGLCGLGEAAPPTVQGRDFAGIFRGQEGPRPTSALYMSATPDRPAEGRRGLRTHRWTYVVDRTGPAEATLLHDNLADPYQQANVAGDHPRIVADLAAELAETLTRTGDPWPPSS